MNKVLLMPRFSIIIPTYNSAATLVPLLEAITAQSNENVEVIVVDDASTETLLKSFPGTYVRQDRRGGPAAARNRGASLAQGEWLVFTDADTLFLEDTMANIAATVDHGDGDAFVGTYAGIPANAGFMPRYKGLWELVTIDEALLARGGDYIPYNTWAPRPGLVRKDAFEAVGGFNERFTGADLEDMEFGYRLVEAGYRIFFAPAIKIRHHYPATFWKEIRPFARRCMLWMGLKKPGGFDAAGEGSRRQALAHLSGFGVFWVLLFSLLFPPFLVLALLLAGYYLWSYRRFVDLAFREEGPWFALRAFVVCWIHTVVMGFSAGLGLMKRFMARG